MTINVATLMTILLLLSLFDTKAWFLLYPSKQAGEVSEQLSALNMNILNVAVCVVALLAITTALLIMYCLKKRFFRDKRRANPIKLIAGVLYFAASVKRHEPYLNRAFRYGEGRKHRIELAKQKYDGIYTSEEVEDVKTFCWILFLLISFVPGYTFSYGGGLAFLTSALTNTTLAIVPGNPYFASNIIWVINCGIIIIILPVINHLVLPFWPNVSIKSKLGVGILLNVLSLAFGGYIIWWQKPLTSEQLFCWLILPALLISIAEALVFVSALEFIYAQSPDNMKGLLTGLMYFIFAIFSSLGSLFDYNYTHSPKRDAWFLFILLVVSMLGLVVYTLAARCYQNRKRPASDGSEDEVKRRGIYENVFSQRFT